MRVLVCQLLFCHLISEVDGTSACNPLDRPPVETTRPHSTQIVAVPFEHKAGFERELSPMGDVQKALAWIAYWAARSFVMLYATLVEREFLRANGTLSWRKFFDSGVLALATPLVN